MQNGEDNKVILDDGTVGWDTGNDDVRVRFGWDSLRDLGRKLCALVNRTRPLIVKAFGDNILVIALLDLIDALCPLIENIASPFSNGNSIVAESNTKSDLVANLRRIADKVEGAGV